MNRVEKHADREDGLRPEGSPGYCSIIHLPEILAEVRKVGVNSKKVGSEYFELLDRLGSEFRILMETPLDDNESAGSPLIREAISRVRSGRVNIAPGFDGEYGKIKILEEVRKKAVKGQKRLF